MTHQARFRRICLCSHRPHHASTPARNIAQHSRAFNMAVHLLLTISIGACSMQVLAKQCRLRPGNSDKHILPRCGAVLIAGLPAGFGVVLGRNLLDVSNDASTLPRYAQCGGSGGNCAQYSCDNAAYDGYSCASDDVSPHFVAWRPHQPSSAGL